MRYYAQYNASGKLIAIGTGCGGTEITEAEYNDLLTEIREKASLVGQLYSGEITEESVKEDWREEIKRRVNERIEQMGEIAEQEVEPAEVLANLFGRSRFTRAEADSLKTKFAALFNPE